MEYITVNDLFTFGILIVSVITLVITIMSKKK
ncbi:MAG: putative holin-like toxin [Acutalibacteraceae bacterium]